MEAKDVGGWDRWGGRGREMLLQSVVAAGGNARQRCGFGGKGMMLVVVLGGGGRKCKIGVEGSRPQICRVASFKRRQNLELKDVH